MSKERLCRRLHKERLCRRPHIHSVLELRKLHGLSMRLLFSCIIDSFGRLRCDFISVALMTENVSRTNEKELCNNCSVNLKHSG